MWRGGIVVHEDHKNHKIVFGFASSLSICFVTFVFCFVVFVVKQASSFAQSIVVPNASAHGVFFSLKESRQIILLSIDETREALAVAIQSCQRTPETASSPPVFAIRFHQRTSNFPYRLARSPARMSLASDSRSALSSLTRIQQ